MDRDDDVIQWLMDSGDPSIRFLTLTDLLEAPRDSAESGREARRIPEGEKVRSLLSDQQEDGGFGVHPYKKWNGAHWRLVSLMELGIPPGFPPAIAAAQQVLKWLWGSSHRGGIKEINRLTRRCASQEGNALAVCSRLGMAEDERVSRLAESLQSWQWPDGGWNCDVREDAHHSSFYESLSPMWGLLEHHKATGDRGSLRAAERTAELLLRHSLFRSEETGEVINPEWLKLHYPLYWHYDILQSLLIISRLGKLSDPRSRDALDLLESKRLKDGRWRPGDYYWRPLGSKGSHLEVVDWGRGGPNHMITLNALRVLKRAGRIA